jgi:hypothetical protein
VDPPTGELLQPVQPGCEKRRVAAELVDDEACDELLVGSVQQGHRAVHRGEDSPAVDVAHHDHRHVGVTGEPHVDVVAGAEVDLGGAAGALTQDQVEPVGEVVVRGVGGGREMRATVDEVPG